MRTVSFCCPFVPPEWIVAHGLQPRCVMPSAPQDGAGTHPPTGMCPYAHAYLFHVSRENDGGATVFTTTCDQMRRAPELLRISDPLEQDNRRVFLMHVPTSWDTMSAQRLYRSELRRLGHFLETLGGSAPTHARLVEVMLAFDRQRTELRDARGRLSARQFMESLRRLHDGQPLTFEELPVPLRPHGIPVALVGSPLMNEHLALVDLVEAAGGEIVLDATDGGELTLPPPFDRRRFREEPFEVLADTYFGQIPGAFRRPNSLFYQHLEDAIARRGIRGVIFRDYLWCDTWHAEAQRLKDWAPIPTLILDAEGQEVNQRTASRVQAFVEVLR